MAGTQSYIGIKNGVVLCIDHYLGYDMNGLFYHGYSLEPVHFGDSAELLRKLEKKGYPDIRRDDKDRRQIIIRLTQEGRELKNRAVHVPKTLAEEHWLTDEEFATFKALLYKLLEGDWGK